MIKDIVVNLSVAEGGGFAGDFAVSVASAFGAHLTGIAFVYDPIVPVSATGYIPAGIIESQQRRQRSRGKAAIDRFDAAAKRAGVSAEPPAARQPCRRRRTVRPHRAALRSRHRRPGRPRQRTPVEELIAESTLFESGRPVIVVPYIQKAPLKLDRVMVCWDGSRQAARAIADAMPLLERAGQVEVVIVANERGKQDEIPRRRYGPAPRPSRTEGGRQAHYRAAISTCADALLSHAADASTDFIVMGGYGHSRLREFVLGGVTHGILRSMTVPALMSH